MVARHIMSSNGTRKKVLVNETQQTYYSRHRDKVLARAKLRYRTHRAELLERQHQYSLTHKKERSVSNAKYYREHSEYLKAYFKAYRKKYRPWLTAKQRVYVAKKRGLPPEEIARLQEEADRLGKECKGGKTRWPKRLRSTKS